MPLPKWNDEWEKSDPLRGRRGCARYHYATVAAAAVLVLAAFGVAVPAIARARQAESNVDREYERFQTRMAEGVNVSREDR